jgi:hypothetical protein
MASRFLSRYFDSHFQGCCFRWKTFWITAKHAAIATSSIIEGQYAQRAMLPSPGALLKASMVIPG